ncbi:MAG: dihydrodipicolinate synthase family protein [Cephaloticoccus sp.]|nr:dihydrodipicolinate synthase family protein [Cephaloticoccus sp.]MCF7759153.1 dihydrodipicolinate synthase family protein [Cephaloticoccus sp.]
MTPLTRDTLQGVWGTLLLPLRDDDSIDFDLLRLELQHLVDAGVSGVYSNGSAGEFWTQSEAEFDRINGMLADICTQSGMPFQIGASHTSPQATLELVRRARELRPSGLQVILPDWLPVGVSEAIAFLGRVAKVADGIPLILYNPPHAKPLFNSAELLQVINAVPEIVGIKVLGGDANWYAEMKPVLEKISVFVAGHRMASGCQQGARGCYSNVACLSPKGAQRWWELIKTDPSAALALETRILNFWTTQAGRLMRERGVSGTAIDKMMASAGGWLPGMTPRLRWPYQFIDQATATEVGRIARVELPELFG